MTVGIDIKCSDGIVLACDSLTTFGRGVPVLRYNNKVHTLEHENLKSQVAIISAGMTAYFNKFWYRACRTGIKAAFNLVKRKLDIIDFSEKVCEPVVTALLKDYAIDRGKFLGTPMTEFSLSLIVAGATYENELQSYLVYPDGISEPIEHYGTIGSGAAYAELFLRFLLAEPEVKVSRAAELAIYAVKGVELMDPNVGGDTNVKIITLKEGKLAIKSLLKRERPKEPRHKMEKVLQHLGKGIEELVQQKGAKYAKK